MSSVNPHYTFEYSQPDAYRFSHDSVFLARRVFETLKHTDITSLRGLDLCAGSGVIGLDFIFHCQKELGKFPRSFDFLEVQEIYIPHFQKNLETLGTQASCEMIIENYSSLTTAPYQDRYDVIVCNPPYFRLGQGKLSPSDFKNRCRFFMDSDFATLLKAIENCLIPGGSAFMLLRDLEEHGWNPMSEAKKLLTDSRIHSLSDIRGTGVVQIIKNYSPT